MADQPDPNSAAVKEYKLNHVGLLNLNANDSGAALENNDKLDGADRDHDGYVDGDADRKNLLEEELALSKADRLESTRLAEVPEHDGKYAHCFRDMTARERESLREKRESLVLAERQGGQDSIAARNAKLDLAIEKAEIIKAHGTAGEREHAEKVELGALREQAVLGKAELAMQGKPPAEQRAIERDALQTLSAAESLKKTPDAPNFGQKGALETLFSIALLRTMPSSAQESRPAATISKPSGFVPGGMN